MSHEEVGLRHQKKNFKDKLPLERGIKENTAPVHNTQLMECIL